MAVALAGGVRTVFAPEAVVDQLSLSLYGSWASIADLSITDHTERIFDPTNS